MERSAGPDCADCEAADFAGRAIRCAALCAEIQSKCFTAWYSPETCSVPIAQVARQTKQRSIQDIKAQLRTYGQRTRCRINSWITREVRIKRVFLEVIPKH